MLHTVTLGVLLVLTSSTNSVSRVMKLNQTSEITLEEISRIDHGISHVWRIIFYTALFLFSKSIKYSKRNGSAGLLIRY